MRTWVWSVDIYTLFIHACTASYACECDVVWAFKLVPQKMSLWKGRKCVDIYSLLQAYHKLQRCDQVFSSVFKNSLCVQNWTFPDLYFSNFVSWKWRRSTLRWYSWSTSFYRFRRHHEFSTNNVVLWPISHQPVWTVMLYCWYLYTFHPRISICVLVHSLVCMWVWCCCVTI